MKNKTIFLALEGADGVGKSTLSLVLAKKLDAISYTAPTKEFLKKHVDIDKNASLEKHFEFYKSGILDASSQIESMLKSGTNVVVDRYWLSTYTYHNLGGLGVTQESFGKIILPTLTVILSLNKEKQVDRILKKDKLNIDQKSVNNQERIATAFYENVLKLNVPFLIIDTQAFSPEASAEIILKALKSGF